MNITLWALAESNCPLCYHPFAGLAEVLPIN